MDQLDSCIQSDLMKDIAYLQAADLDEEPQDISICKSSQKSPKKNIGSDRGSLELWWEIDKEPNQQVEWVKCQHPLQKDLKELEKEMKIGEPLTLETIKHQKSFCPEAVVNQILEAKDKLDKLDKQKLNEGRSRANRFETVRSAFFMNRAALKMANIDRITDFMFTDIENNPCFRDDGRKHKIFYFADVCAGPGGFTEYILWRKKWQFKGFGFTLKDCGNDFTVNRSPCVSDATFQPLFGSEKFNNGDIFIPENITSFRDDILKDTDGKGVHFMMADGGFSVAGQENLQEVLSKQLYACQCYMALEILRPFGHFMSKLFDVFTQFSAGLIFLMYQCFEKIAIVKPNASRPANSERYLICYGLKTGEHVETIRAYLCKIVKKLHQMRQKDDIKDKDILELVSQKTLKDNKTFYTYIRTINNQIAQSQINALKLFVEHYNNLSYLKDRQAQERRECLKYWKIPDESREHQALKLPNVIPAKLPFFHKEVEFSELPDMRFDWTVKCLYSNSLRLVIGDRQKALEKALDEDSKFQRIRLKLVPGTVLYGEIVEEVNVGKDGKEIEEESFHVIDAAFLGGEDLQKKLYNERLSRIEAYCHAVNFESNKYTMRIRAKENNLVSENLNNLLGYKFCRILPKLGAPISHTYSTISALMFTSNEQVPQHYVVKLTNKNKEEFLNFIRR